jgi:hypothetical protein
VRDEDPVVHELYETIRDFREYRRTADHLARDANDLGYLCRDDALRIYQGMPLINDLMAADLHRDSALSQQVLDIPEAEGKPGIEPDGLLNNHGWEAISGVADFAHDRHLWPQISAGKLNNVTMPSAEFDRSPFQVPSASDRC